MPLLLCKVFQHGSLAKKNVGETLKSSSIFYIKIKIRIKNTSKHFLNVLTKEKGALNKIQQGYHRKSSTEFLFLW